MRSGEIPCQRGPAQRGAVKPDRSTMRHCCEDIFGKLSTLECKEVESGKRTLQSSRAKEAELRKGLLKRIPGDELLECLPDELQEEIDSSR